MPREILLVENWYLKWTRSWTKFQNTGTSNLSAAGENSLKYIPETEKIVLRKKPVFPSNLMSLLLRSVQCSLRNERVESESNILYFNLSSWKRFRLRRNVVVCLIPLGLWKRKPALGEGYIDLFATVVLHIFTFFVKIFIICLVKYNIIIIKVWSSCNIVKKTLFGKTFKSVRSSTVVLFVSLNIHYWMIFKF